jgi:predicted short-subunit dehydrogenase-like oxidoreductase (DUF2520 family)
MITLVGSGNVATWMAQRLQGSSRFPVTQVYSRKLENARQLAALSGAEAIDDIKALNPDNQIFIFALVDNAYETILPQLPFRLPAAYLTSGTFSCQCLKAYADSYGVIYPLQTFTKSQDMRGMEVPLCLEYQESTHPGVETQPPQECGGSYVGAEHPQECGGSYVGAQPPQECGGSYEQMWSLARELSPLCYEVSEAQRARMHLAAVFACNFSNAMYHIAYKLLEEKGLPFEMLLPLLRQTVEKVSKMPPAEAQTGPAARRDFNVMEAHLAELDDEGLQEIYRMMSEMIIQDEDEQPR